MPFTRNLAKKIPFVRLAVIEARHLRARIKIRSLLKSGRDLSIEIGAGAKRGRAGWLTLDLNQACDLSWDLRRGMPFPDQSLKNIYSSHFFEHLTYHETQVLLDECMRTLVPGGKFLVCVPNAKLYLEAYIRGQDLDPRFFEHKPAYNRTTSIDIANYVAYMDGEHKYMFDPENLLHILNAKGFKNVSLRKFNPDLDMRERDFESIYATAER